MDYKRIYKQLMIRAKLENRVKTKDIYYESHHIIPLFMFKTNPRNKSGVNAGHLSGDGNCKTNKVLLTPREHFIAHAILYKIYKGTRYEYSCGSALMLFFNVAKSKHIRVKTGNFITISKKYEKYRKIGLDSISNRRKGMMPVKDSATGIMIGEAPVDHPKVISGEWIHHSKGTKSSSETRAKLSAIGTGRGNNNARIINIEYIKLWLLKFSDIVHLKFDGNFIASHFKRWFDSHNHTEIFYYFEHSNKILPQKISRMKADFLKLKEIALHTSITNNLNWKLPSYGMGKYKDIVI